MTSAAPTTWRIYWLIVWLGLALALALPLVTSAAFDDVTLTSITISLSGISVDVTADSATIESITVNSNSFDVALQATSTITVSSANKREFSTTPGDSSNFTKTFTCGDSSSTLKVEGKAAITVTIAPHASGTCSAPAAAAAGGGGGGGGGSVTQNIPATTPPTAQAPAATPTPAALPSAVFSTDLALGDRNDDVRRLQQLLAADASIYPEGLVTGYFGPATQAAVKRFQAKYGLPLVGRVGPLTRSKLAEVFLKAVPPPAPTPPPPPAPAAAIVRALTVGSRGDDVTTLQTFLAKDKAVYPEGLVTGYFGPATQVAVKRFQEKHSIAKPGDAGYGFIGPKTRAKLNELAGAPPAPAPTPAPSADEAAKIKALQDQLQELQVKLKALQGQ